MRALSIHARGGPMRNLEHASDARPGLESIGSVPKPASRVGELLRALDRHRGGPHVVVIRGYPDPDSLASAWAHCRLVASLGLSCDIAHLPALSRAENRAMVNILEMPLVRLANAGELDRYAALSLVDAHVLDGPKRAGPPCVSIVDHHAIGVGLDAEFVDVRLAVGATSTIYTEYLVEAEGKRLGRGALSPRLSTALAYGIRSDTDDLLRATSADFIAMSELAPSIDANLLAALSRYPIPIGAMRIIRCALEALRVCGTWAMAGVGLVHPRDRDAIGQAADFLLRQEGLTTVVTFGVVDGWIDGSLRTTDPALDPALWLRDAFGLDSSRTPYGGGRRGKGGFQIPLGPLAASSDRELLWQLARGLVEETIARRAGLTGLDGRFARPVPPHPTAAAHEDDGAARLVGLPVATAGDHGDGGSNEWRP